MDSPILAFTDYTKDFLLKADTSKEGLGAVLSQKQVDGWFRQVVYGSWALTAHEKNYHSTKLEFLALKWAATEHFKEYLLYQPFLAKTDNNPLTYIMTTPNLDATGHWWVGALAKLNFQLEYQKGWDNAVADVLSQITTCLGARGCPSCPRWSNHRCFPESGKRKPHCDWKWPTEGNRSTSHCWASPSGDACDRLGSSPKWRPWTTCSLQWLESKKKTDLRTTPWGACFEQGGPDGMEKLPKFYYPPRYSLPVLYPKGGEWGSVALHSAKDALDCCPEGVSSRCMTSRPWPYSISITRMFLVARDGQADKASY